MSNKSHKGLKFYTVKEIAGPIIFCESVPGVGFGEVVNVQTQDNKEKIGQVIDISDEITLIQEQNLTAQTTQVRLTL